MVVYHTLDGGLKAKGFGGIGRQAGRKFGVAVD